MVSGNNDGCKEKVEAYWILKRITPVTNNHDIKKHLVYYTNKDKNEYFAPNGQSRVWACSAVRNWHH